MPHSRLKKSAFPAIHPFSGQKNRFFCMKNHCNALFFTEEKLANHEKFCHSEHPLGGEDSPEKSETTAAEEPGVGVENLKVQERIETDGDKVYKTMVKMSSAFFGEFLGRGKDSGAGTETAVAAEKRKLQ